MRKFRKGRKRVTKPISKRTLCKRKEAMASYLMKRNVDIEIYDYEKLLDVLMKKMRKELAEDILSDFGTKLDSKYVLLNNEFYEEFNPSNELHYLLEIGFDIGYDEISGVREGWGPGGNKTIDNR
jgi:hypothetical protein